MPRDQLGVKMSKVIKLDNVSEKAEKGNDFKKGWSELNDRVDKELHKRYHSVPIAERRQLGLEEGKDSHENRLWVGKYLEALIWRDMCYELLQEKVYSKGESSD